MSQLPDNLRNWSEGDAYLAPRKTKRMLDDAADRIELLEDALRLCIDMITVNNVDIPHTLETARAALEGKDD